MDFIEKKLLKSIFFSISLENRNKSLELYQEFF